MIDKEDIVQITDINMQQQLMHQMQQQYLGVFNNTTCVTTDHIQQVHYLSFILLFLN